MIICLFQSSVSAVSVLKTYRYDWNIYYKSSMNYHRYSYINVLLCSRYYSYSEYKVDSGCNYNRYEVINYYSGGY
ncbi:hypothetical protein [Streptococcus pneumoniae]|uniref:hypothetical protein n=1 Tax=Streptococcus pneumoniae TaxID=1313 RepID=UPI00067C48F5|nr:hypothetical protein [Streptococcus pneumoniae]